MKVFCQGTKFIPLDENVINSGIRWLQNNQENDGSYHEKNIVRDHKMMVSSSVFCINTIYFNLIKNEELVFFIHSLLSRKKYHLLPFWNPYQYFY